MKSKRGVKEILIRLCILAVGLTIAHLGVTLFLMADLGADPFNVLVQGVYRGLYGLTGWELLTHGRVHIAMCFIIIIALLIIDRSYVKLGTIFCMVCGGPIIDFFTALLAGLLPQNSTLIAKLVTLAAGCVILAYGMTMVIKSDAGTGPNDLVAVVISDKLHRKFGVVRIITDVAFVAVGLLLGGVAGIGTVVCAFLVGPVAGLFLPLNGRLVNRMLTALKAQSEIKA